MDRESFSNSHGTVLMAIFIIGSSVVLGAGSEAKQDAWISIIISMAMALPIIAIYSRLLKIYPGKNLFDLLHLVFGNIFGKVLSLLYTWYAFHLGALVMRDFTEFIQIVSLQDTPQFVLALFMGIICIWAAKEGVEVITRCAGIVFVITCIGFMITIPISLVNAQFINLKPVLGNGMMPVLDGAFTTFSFPFAETVLFTTIFSGLKDRKKTFKVYFLGLLIGGMILFVTTFRNVLVLIPGQNAYFPSFMAVRLAQLGDFIERIEVIVAAIFTFAGLGKIMVCLLAASKGLGKVLNLDNYRKVVTPVGLLMIVLSLIIYTNVMEMFDWTSKVYKYYALPFQVILPVVIWIVAEIKTKSLKRVRGRA